MSSMFVNSYCFVGGGSIVCVCGGATLLPETASQGAQTTHANFQCNAITEDIPDFRNRCATGVFLLTSEEGFLLKFVMCSEI